MTAIYRLLLIAMLAALGTPASAEPSYAGRYEMVTVRQSQDSAMRTVLILDKRTGELWTWSESSVVTYAGKIFPVTTAGPFARIIHVDPGKDGR